MKKLIYSGCLLVVSVILTVGSLFAWFMSQTQISLPSGSIVVEDLDITSLFCTFYRSDGIRYELNSEKCFDDQNNEIEMEFAMIEFDTIITEKNKINNLIMVVEVSFSSNIENTDLIAKITTPNNVPFVGNANGIYNLSDVIKVGMLSNIDLLSATTNQEIYTLSTEAFSSVEDVYKKRFTSITDSGENQKNTTLSFSNIIPSKTESLILCFNIEYDETLVRKLYGEGFGEFDEVGSEKIPLKSDLSYNFKTGVVSNA